jgi:hypothetical protein
MMTESGAETAAASIDRVLGHHVRTLPLVLSGTM